MTLDRVALAVGYVALVLIAVFVRPA